MNGKFLEQISLFNSLGLDVSFKFNKDIEKKINTFQTICLKIRRNLGRKQ